MLEIGANIGACTIELLVRTSARVIAFEPNPIALFHLTRNLQRAARQWSHVASRVVVYPIAAGDRSLQSSIFTQEGNLGNAVIGESGLPNGSGLAVLSRASEQSVTVQPLDALFPSGLPIQLLKIDTQVQGATASSAK